MNTRAFIKTSKIKLKCHTTFHALRPQEETDSWSKHIPVLFLATWKITEIPNLFVPRTCAT